MYKLINVRTLKFANDSTGEVIDGGKVMVLSQEKFDKPNFGYECTDMWIKPEVRDDLLNQINENTKFPLDVEIEFIFDLKKAPKIKKITIVK